MKNRQRNINTVHENAVGSVGIKTIDMESFYHYCISTGEMALKNILTENEIVSTLVDDKYDSYITANVGNRTVQAEYKFF